jgi:hypothetical protein
MKNSRTRVGLFSGAAAVVLLSVVLVGVGPATAASHPSALNPVGVYNYFDGGIIIEGGAATTINVNANGTFNLLYSTITDNGVWLMEGRTIALTVTSGEDGSAGCLLLGTVVRRGINSSAKQGPIDCQAEFGKSGTWYAVVPHHVR